MKIARGYVLVLGAVLAACAPQPSGEPAPATTTEAPAFHFQSGDLPLGEFDPHTIGENLFDPCSEISDAEFAEAGFSKDPSGPIDQSAIGLKSCPIETSSDVLGYGLISNRADSEIIESKTPRLPKFQSDVLPDAFAVSGVNGEPPCYFAVETERGTFAAYAGSLFPDADIDQLCLEAQNVLESFYLSGRNAPAESH
ncbi:DUF3558 family protein [uncultured Corynebacterium sp.]|uniref:DUF3558 family protein n=1 Tax=uncultured Corynebacterium sp. TaxID=159447 RepID=UPI0025941072|nr:DUF3558 family protein [uncultured Corynebacterium sp.]